MLASMAVHSPDVLGEPPHTSQFGSQVEAAATDHLRYYIGHIGFVVGFPLLLPGVLALAGRLADAGRGARARLGVAFTLVGIFGAFLSLGIDLAIYQLTTPERGGEAATEALAGTNFELLVLGPVFTLASFLGLGLSLLALEAARAGLTPRWSAAAIAFGAFGWVILFNTPLAIPNAAIFALGLGRLALGWASVTARNSTVPTGAPVSQPGGLVS
jgi:hypothetical protein